MDTIKNSFPQDQSCLNAKIKKSSKNLISDQDICDYLENRMKLDKSIPKIDMSILTLERNNKAEFSNFKTQQVTHPIQEDLNRTNLALRDEKKSSTHSIPNNADFLFSRIEERHEVNELAKCETTYSTTTTEESLEYAYFKSMLAYAPWIYAEIMPDVKKYEKVETTVFKPTVENIESYEVKRKDLPPHAPAPDPFEHENFSFSSFHKSMLYDSRKSALSHNVLNSHLKSENDISALPSAKEIQENSPINSTRLSTPSKKRHLETAESKVKLAYSQKQMKEINLVKMSNIQPKNRIVRSSTKSKKIEKSQFLI